MEEQTRKVLIGTGIAATGMVVAAGVTQVVADYLVRLAVDRKGVRAFDRKLSKVAGTPENAALLARMRYKARRLEPLCSEVHIQSKDGLTLTGHWRGCPDPKRIIIAMHGWRSNWAMDFGMISDFWYQNGCSVLYAEQRGQGRSGGNYIGFGMLERHDCRAWVDWVNREVSADVPIYLAGVSMGATTVLMTAGMELPDNVRGIIADCGFTSADAIWKHVARHNLHISYGLHAAAADALCRKRLHIGAKDYSTLDAMAECEVPVLLIHGTEDTFVPIEMTYENYKACAAPKHLFVVPGADHGMCYRKEKLAYEKTMLDFWRAYDEKNTPA